MAAHIGMSPSAVGRIGRRHGLQPERLEVFGLSDPDFTHRVAGAALYLRPAQGVLVLVVDDTGAGPMTAAHEVTTGRGSPERAAVMADLHEALTLAATQEVA